MRKKNSGIDNVLTNPAMLGIVEVGSISRYRAVKQSSLKFILDLKA